MAEDSATTVFEAERPRLVGLAYRITGCRPDAEDAVQEAWLRWSGTDRATVRQPAAWLTTVTSRIALDRLRSAQKRREAYVGPWLAEVVSAEPRTGPADDPEAAAELADSLSLGFLAVLERLEPIERVVFLLAEVFAVPHAEIADVVDRSPGACRQIASRARRRVREDRPRRPATDRAAWEVTTAFLAAAQQGDIAALTGLLAEDAVAISDGGPDHRAARRPVVGRDRVARYVANLAQRVDADASVVLRSVNSTPGVVIRNHEGIPVMAVSAEVIDGQVQGLLSLLNPDKLATIDFPPVC